MSQYDLASPLFWADVNLASDTTFPNTTYPNKPLGFKCTGAGGTVVFTDQAGAHTWAISAGEQIGCVSLSKISSTANGTTATAIAVAFPVPT